MAKHDLNAVALPKLDEGQLASLAICPFTVEVLVPQRPKAIPFPKDGRCPRLRLI